MNLLLRFYDPDEGTVFLEGRDIRTIPPEELRPKFGVVFQNDFIMEGALMAGNIRFCRELPQEEVDRAARTAQADYIFQKGMSHPVAVRGNNLSGGQKQRLTIARALAGKPDILVLDDASSALDYRTDAALRQALRREMAGVTQMIVAQRVSSLRHAGSDSGFGGVAGSLAGGNHQSLLQTRSGVPGDCRNPDGNGKEGNRHGKQIRRPRRRPAVNRQKRGFCSWRLWRLFGPWNRLLLAAAVGAFLWAPTFWPLCAPGWRAGAINAIAAGPAGWISLCLEPGGNHGGVLLCCRPACPLHPVPGDDPSVTPSGPADAAGRI
ncbi:MAG: ATP-binding cassette domain-containing protein [Oscillospiraceae bacterium]